MFLLVFNAEVHLNYIMKIKIIYCCIIYSFKTFCIFEFSYYVPPKNLKERVHFNTASCLKLFYERVKM